ncbi:MAG: MBOAT family O-acyltransferase [bacterium]
MLFNSREFLFFFPIVTSLYFWLPHKYRWFMLLAASCIFYMSFIPIYILILFFTIAIDYIAGILIEGAAGNRRQLFLILSIISNVSILCFFKYFNFFNSNTTWLLSWLNVQNPIPELSIILPIGLSFHTFQAMSYTIEVYRGNQKAERHLGIYALYVMFYPQLVAGPIERPQNLLHQFHEEHNFDYLQVTNGLKLMAWGFFKKLVIADRLALFVNPVYTCPKDFQGVSFIFSTILFAFQIYCDFSGYSDIAIGTAQVMGFKLMQNFDRPYLSTSVSEFWRRWHISLTTWFTDYIYIPLGGNRVSRVRWLTNLMIVFLISGLWHGANWTFIIWGALNGFYLVFGAMTKNLRNQLALRIGLTKFPVLRKILQTIITFSLICFSWIFFRAKTVSDALYIIRNLFTGVFDWLYFLFTHLSATASGKLEALVLSNMPADLVIAVLVILLLILIEWLQTTKNVTDLIRHKSWPKRWLVYYILIISIIVFGIYSNAKFIYFQF